MKKNLSKNLLAAFLCVSAATPVFAQDVEINATNFPDPVFRQYLIDTFSDLASDGKFTQEEIQYIKIVEPTPVNGHVPAPIKTLKGIELLTSVEKLSIMENELTELDLSNNRALKELNCSGNNKPGLNVIKNLDLTNNTKLTHLWIHGCGMETLKLPENAPLLMVSVLNNNLERLDIPESSRSSLMTVSISNNPMVALDITGVQNGMYLAHNNGRTINVNYYYEEDGQTYYYIDLNADPRTGSGIELLNKLPNSGFDLNKVVANSWNGAEVVNSPYTGTPILRLKGKPDQITYNYDSGHYSWMDGYEMLSNPKFYLKLTYENLTVGVEGVNADNTHIYGAEGAIRIESDNDAVAEVYSMEGRQMYRGTDKVIPMNQGIYLVKINKTTQKVVVK